MSDSESYEIQFSLDACDTQGNPLQVCFHGAGRLGFDTISEAEEYRSLLRSVDQELNRTVTYDIRPVLVSTSWTDEFTVDLDEDGLKLVIAEAKKDSGAN